MQRSIPLLALTVVASASAIAFTASSRDVESVGHTSYEVTVTNVTKGQIFSPLLLATHAGSVSLFEAGMPASPELAILAEGGDTGPLTALLAATPGVADVALGGGMLPPGASETIFIEASGSAHRLSLASMLVSTNDTFAALDAIPLPRGAMSRTFAVAWDAGSEFNSESCDTIPGPPCGMNFHDPSPSEGFVHVSNGIHGDGDLDPATYDWKNYVATIEIRRVD